MLTLHRVRDTMGDDSTASYARSAVSMSAM